ncbi:MAG TPA: ATP-dependent DNA ligase [Vicinamibacterales bacterium]|nr:ATP-dependent DNA ligase [Vicinamibacterales bacterium]
MLLHDLVAVSAEVSRVPGRLEKIARLAALLQRLTPIEVSIAVPFLTGSLRQGRIGIGHAAIQAAADAAAAAEATLTIGDADAAFAAMAGVRGAGSTAARTRMLRELFARATHDERDFLVRLLHGELRQGAVEGVLLDAVARASSIAADRIRRAAMVSGALAPVAVAALVDGEAALRAMDIALFAPLQPMLAGSAGDIDDALGELGAADVEFKLDGARIQVHKAGDEVRVYSRSLRDVTPAVRDVVAAVAQLPARELILDGEALALRPDGTPHPFQITMRRFGRKQDGGEVRDALPLSPFFFDCLYLDGTPTIDEPLSRRVALLEGVVPAAMQVPRVAAATREQAAALVAHAEATGHEGVMVKARDASYAAGRRGTAWLKVKRAHTLDLVVLAAEWGSGRRRGSLSNLHLGARDADRGGFVMLGKTFKGLTDEILAWQTGELLAREIGRDGQVVFVRPELVVEIAFNDIQESPQYPGGLALRFARVKRYRGDKTAGQSDTIATVRALYTRATGLGPPVR